MLGYKIKNGKGEILMTHGGTTIDKWQVKLRSKDSMMEFVLSMIRQVLLGLKIIHALGYSHGDLKPENILLADPLCR